MIRPATRDDLPAVVALIRGLADYERLPLAADFDEARLAEHLFGPTPHAEVLLAEMDGDAVGFAVYFMNYATFQARPGVYLEDLFVRPAFRNRGFGRKLLTAVANIAVARGGGWVQWAVLDWNELAIEFYRSLGAAPMDEWTVYRVSGDALTALAAS